MISYRCSIDINLLSWTVFEILSLISIWVTILTFQGHVTSSVTWPYNLPYTISYRCSTEADTLAPTNFETLSTKCIGVMTVSFQGHVTSSTMWPFDSHYMISYRCSIDTVPLSWTVFEILSRIRRATGCDGIPPELLKCAVDPVSTTLHLLFT